MSAEAQLSLQLKSTSPHTCMKLAVGLRLLTRRKYFSRTSRTWSDENKWSAVAWKTIHKGENARGLTKQCPKTILKYISSLVTGSVIFPSHLELPRRSQLNGRSSHFIVAFCKTRMYNLRVHVLSERAISIWQRHTLSREVSCKKPWKPCTFLAVICRY